MWCRFSCSERGYRASGQPRPDAKPSTVPPPACAARIAGHTRRLDRFDAARLDLRQARGELLALGDDFVAGEALAGTAGIATPAAMNA
jgi:hypothetical protein